MILATILTGIVSNLVFEIRNGYFSLRQQIVYAGPGLRIGPIFQYLPIFGILTILATLFTGIVSNLIFAVLNGC